MNQAKGCLSFITSIRIVGLVVLLCSSFLQLPSMLDMLDHSNLRTSLLDASINATFDPRDMNSLQRPTQIHARQKNYKISEHVKFLISEYKLIVTDNLHFQAASWFRYLGGYRVEERNVNIDATYKSFQRRRKRRAVYSKTEILNQTMVWDTEEDIPKYFKQLTQACRQHNLSTNIYAEKCLLAMYNLIHEPRCTVRLDSRTRCDGQPRKHHLMNASSIFELGSYNENVVNVVIVGGGPIGLYLANLLTQLPILHEKELQQEKYTKSEQTLPRFNIVVFENRVIAEGHKIPYTRRWGTETGMGLKGQMDPRIWDLFKVLHSSGSSPTLPINFWETMLLLSCRDLGVKFIYGDIEDFEQTIASVENLVMFDASGHRLQPLVRGGHANQDKNRTMIRVSMQNSTKLPLYFRWNFRSEEDRSLALKRWRFPSSWIEPIPELSGKRNYATHLLVAVTDSGAGPIAYPVFPNQNAFFVYRFDMLHIPYDSRAKAELKSIVETSELEFRQQQQLEEKERFFQGFPIVDYGGDYSIDPKVWEHILATNQKSFTGFDENGFSIKPTEEQGKFLERLLRIHSLPGESAIPWSRINETEYKGNPVLKTNRVDELLEMATRCVQYETPGVTGISASAYRSRPYMYADPVIPGGFPLASINRHVPFLRVGNSLLSGDTDISSGLNVQMAMMRFLQSRILQRYS